MNETMTYADAFTRAFAREPEFLSFLHTMQDRSRWERQPARELEIIALDEHDPLTAPKSATSRTPPTGSTRP